MRLKSWSGFASGLRFENFYPAVAWFAWVPNLIVAEWWFLRRHGQDRNSPSVESPPSPLR